MLRYHGLLLLNKHSDIFLLHNFGLQIIPFEMEKLKKVYNQSEKKKIMLKLCTKFVVQGYKLWSWKQQLEESFKIA